MKISTPKLLCRAYNHIFEPKQSMWKRALQVLAKVVLLFAGIIVFIGTLVAITSYNDKVSTTTITVCQVKETTHEGIASFSVLTSDGKEYGIVHPDGKLLQRSKAFIIKHDNLNRIIKFDQARDVVPASC